MDLNICLIRHGKTKGNLEKRYIGSTNQSLCEEGVQELKEYSAAEKYPAVDIVICSPLIRCKETAKQIYSANKVVELEGLREYFFGAFEGKSHKELRDNAKYMEWIDSQGRTNLHNGESYSDFAQRCVDAFEQTVQFALEKHYKSLAVVTHGGVIMQIMNFLTDEKDLFQWQMKNGCGLSFQFDTDTYKIKHICEV